MTTVTTHRPNATAFKFVVITLCISAALIIFTLTQVRFFVMASPTMEPLVKGKSAESDGSLCIIGTPRNIKAGDLVTVVFQSAKGPAETIRRVHAIHTLDGRHMYEVSATQSNAIDSRHWGLLATDRITGKVLWASD